MSALWKLPLAIVGTLAALAAVILGLGDREVLVSPPEAVAEGFVRQLAARRFEPARPYLSEELAARTSAARLRELTRRLEQQTGTIEAVRGERVRMRGDRAEAAAILETARAGRVPIRFSLTRREGAWSIERLDGLATPLPAVRAAGTG